MKLDILLELSMEKLLNKDPVRFYYNFHKKTFSIQKRVEGRWRVVDHSNNFMVLDAKFKVSQKGRERVLRERVKNVHAYVYGLWAESGMGISAEEDRTLCCIIKYNPYDNDKFFCENLTLKPFNVTGAMCVKVTNGVVSAAYVD